MSKIKPLIDARQLKVERSFVILKGIDWRVEPGEHWAVLGANGSGKTTLLQTLTAYVTPTSGEMHLCGETYGQANWPELRRRVGVVSTALLQRIGGGETALDAVISGHYAMLNFWGKPTKDDTTRARGLLRRTGIARLAEREWRYLSQGERQRVLIARALMARPALLFLDEPAAGLDPVASEAFLAMVERLCRAKDGPAIVLVTHHVEEIVPAISHVLLIKNGRVLASGEKRKVLTSANLSATFGAEIKLRSRDGRYRLELASGGRLFR